MNRVSYYMAEARSRYNGFWSARVVVLRPTYLCMTCVERINCLVLEDIKKCQVKVEWFVPRWPLDPIDGHEYLQVECRYGAHWEPPRRIEEHYPEDLEWEFFVLTEGLTIEDFNKRVGQ